MPSGSTERQAVFDAIGNWESQFSFPFNEFNHDCTADVLQFYHNEGPWPGWDDCAGVENFVGCFRITGEPYNSTPGGYYITNMQVWLNTEDYDFTYRGARGVTVHELGHLYGLGDMYIHSGGSSYSCNQGLTTIMNSAVVVQGNDVDGICRPGGGTPLDSVQSWDNTKAHWFYVMNNSSFQHQNVEAIQGTSNSMVVFFDDHAPAEWKYRAKMQYWNGSSWTTAQHTDHYSSIAFGDMHTAGLDRSFVWSKTYYMPAAYYRACLELWSMVTGYRYEKCSNYIYLS